MRRWLLVLCVAASASAQVRPVDDDEEGSPGLTVTDEERLYDRIVARLQRRDLQASALLQVVPVVALDSAAASESGFTIPRARVGVRGRFEGGFGLRFQAELGRAPALVDAYVSYAAASGAVVADAGRFKVPFAYEFLTSGAAIDFVRRARAVDALRANRSVGVGVRLAPWGDRASLRAGLFNAVGRLRRDGTVLDDDAPRGGVLGAVRLQAELGATPRAHLVVGANVARDGADRGAGVSARTLVGADARLRAGRLLAAAEALAEAGGEGRHGFHVTAGVDLDADDRLLVRLDRFEGSSLLVAGFNRTFSRLAAVQLNVAVPVAGTGGRAEALANLQVSF